MGRGGFITRTSKKLTDLPFRISFQRTGSLGHQLAAPLQLDSWDPAFVPFLGNKQVKKREIESEISSIQQSAGLWWALSEY